MTKQTLERMRRAQLDARSLRITLRQARADLRVLGLTDNQIDAFLTEIHPDRWVARLKDTCNLSQKLADYADSLLTRLKEV